MAYNPQMWKSTAYRKGINKDPRIGAWAAGNRKPFELQDVVRNGERYPTSIIEFSNADRKQVHPTQKPVALMSYLVKTYTNKGDTVLDFTCGSGSTGVGAVSNVRNFIGIDNGYCEKEGSEWHGKPWVELAEWRIANAAGGYRMSQKEKKTGEMAIFETIG